ncbi:MAG: TatD family hydrolase [Oscillospiraceae bacterium]
MQGIFDSHAHYDDKKFDQDRGELLRSMPANGICRILNIGCDLTSSQKSIDLAEQYDFVYAAVGTHPHEAKMMSRFYLDIYREMAAHPRSRP